MLPNLDTGLRMRPERVAWRGAGDEGKEVAVRERDSDSGSGVRDIVADVRCFVSCCGGIDATCDRAGTGSASIQ